MKIGMVLEGGAMRGMYTAGILDVMIKNNIDVDGFIGVSAGAAFGCNYKSRQFGRTLRYNLKYCNDPRYSSFRSLITTGDLFGADFCYNEIPNKLDPFDTKTFTENPIEFYVVCTDVQTGEPVYHLCNKGDDEDIQWMRASASMPLVSNVVSIGEYDLLDGGISDAIPINWFRSIGYKRNIIILTRPKGFRKEKNNLLPFARILLREYPKFVETWQRHHEIYNASIDEIIRLEENGDALVLSPSRDLGIERIESNPEKLKEVYEIGVKDGNDNLEAMREFIGIKGKLPC